MDWILALLRGVGFLLDIFLILSAVGNWALLFLSSDPWTARWKYGAVALVLTVYLLFFNKSLPILPLA